MSTVLLLGAFGQGNPGDEALCAALVRSLAHHDLVVASPTPDATAARHDVRAIASSPLAVARAVRGVDAVIVAGGTVFKTLPPSSGRRPTALLRNTAAVVALARASGTRIALAGVGAGELAGRRARRLAGWIAPRVDLLALRDEESAAVLKAAGVPAPFWIGADLAWLAVGRSTAPPAAPPSVTVAISHLAGDDGLFARTATALTRLPAGWRIRLQPWQGGPTGADAKLAARLAGELTRAERGADVLSSPPDLDAAVASLAGERLVLAMRFHALVGAALAGTPAVAIAHEPKLGGLARRLQQVAVPAHATVDVLDAAMRHALDDPPASPAAIQREVARAEHVVTLVELLLAGGRVAEPERIEGLPLSAGRGTW